MTRGDQLIERAADRLDEFARRAAGEGGLKGKLARPLAEDAALVRGMRPGLIAARLRGKPVVEGEAARVPAPRVEPAQAGPGGGRSAGGPNPIALAAAAFVVGLLLAKLIDWRSHAYPRR